MWVFYESLEITWVVLNIKFLFLKILNNCLLILCYSGKFKLYKEKYWDKKTSTLGMIGPLIIFLSLSEKL